MKKKVLVLAMMLILSFSCNAFAVPDLMLPFQAGEIWECFQGNYTDPLNVINGAETNITHRSTSNLKYAWDFARSNCLNSPILACAAGQVRLARLAGDWGNTLIIDYGDGSYGLYAHLNSIIVSVGEYVSQGQQIGTCGSTGNSSGAHIHYQTQKTETTYSESIQSSFIDVAENNGVPLEEKFYTSDNYIFPIGRYADGWHSDGTSLAFGKCCDEFRAFL